MDLKLENNKLEIKIEKQSDDIKNLQLEQLSKQHHLTIETIEKQKNTINSLKNELVDLTQKYNNKDLELTHQQNLNVNLKRSFENEIKNFKNIQKQKDVSQGKEGPSLYSSQKTHQLTIETIEKQKNTINTLKDELTDLKQKYNNKDIELINQQNVNKNVKRSFEKEIKISKESYKNISFLYSTQTNELVLHKKKLTHLQTELTDLKQQHNNKDVELRHQQNVNENLKKTLENEIKNSNNLQQQMLEKQNGLDNLNIKYKELQESHKNITCLYSSQTNELVLYKSEIDTLNDKLQDLKQKHNAELTHQQNLNENLMKNLKQSVENEIKNSKNVQQELQETDKNISSTQIYELVLYKKLTHLQKNLDTLKHELTDLKQKYNNKDVELTHQQNVNENLMRSFENEINNSKNVKQQIVEKQNEIDILKYELTDLKQKYNNKDVELTHQQNVNEKNFKNVQQQIVEKQNEIDNLNIKYKELEESHKNLSLYLTPGTFDIVKKRIQEYYKDEINHVNIQNKLLQDELDSIKIKIKQTNN